MPLRCAWILGWRRRDRLRAAKWRPTRLDFATFWEDVEWADWAADGSRFAVIRRVGGRARLKFPPGTTLYETVGDIFFPRISPSQDRIAFVERPQSAYTRGLVRVVDVAGKSVASSEQYNLVWGLAWADEREVWYSAAGEGEDRHFYSPGACESRENPPAEEGVCNRRSVY